MNRKGSVLDIGFAMVAIFATIIIFFIANYVYGEFSVRWGNHSIVNESTASVAAVQDVENLLDTRLDYISFVILMGFTLAIIITGWMVAGNPLFSWIYFIVLVIFVVTSAILSFVWNEFSTYSIFGNLATGTFPIANHILSYFPTYIAIIGFTGMLVMFAKPRG